jgi:hypothetical protein
MAPEIAAFVMPLSIVLIYAGVVSLNIYLAQGEIGYWKIGTTTYFLFSLGASVSRKRVAALWMGRFAYDEADAFRIVKYQFFAMFEFLLIAIIVLLIEVNTLVD